MTSLQVCTFVYGILGTSRQLSIGPEGVISLLSGAALAFDTTSDSVENYVIRASVLAFLYVPHSVPCLYTP